MPQNSDAKVSWLMKEVKCFNCIKNRHTILNCLKKAKVSSILGTSDINDIKDMNQGKK